MKAFRLFMVGLMLSLGGVCFGNEASQAPLATGLPGLSELPWIDAMGYKKLAKPGFSLMKLPTSLPEQKLLNSEEATLLGTIGDITGFCLRSENPTGPYLAAGVGSQAEPEIDPDLEFAVAEAPGQDMAYRVGAGLECNLGEGARLDFGYRFLPDSFLDRGSPFDDDYGKARDDHSISIDLKVPF